MLRFRGITMVTANSMLLFIGLAVSPRTTLLLSSVAPIARWPLRSGEILIRTMSYRETTMVTANMITLSHGPVLLPPPQWYGGSYAVPTTRYNASLGG